jgi:hypothetical protein
VRLADVVAMVRDAPKPAPPVEPVDDYRWRRGLPRAPHQILAPLPAAPGACEQVVPEGSPMPPGAELMHSLTVELVDAYQRRYQFELRDGRVRDERRRLEELDQMEAEIRAQRARSTARIAELEAMEPVDELDWANIARAIWKVSGFQRIPERDLPDDLTEARTIVARGLNRRFDAMGRPTGWTT